MEHYPHLDNDIYNVVDRVMRPLALRQTRGPRSNCGIPKARHSVSSLSTHYFGSSSHLEDDDNNEGTSRASTPSPNSYLNSLSPLTHQTYNILTSSEQINCLLFERRPFLRTTRALIDVHGEKMTLRHDDQSVTFKVGDTKNFSYNAIESVNKVDFIDIACEEYSQEILDFSEVLANENSTSYFEPIIDTTSPTLTPFEGSVRGESALIKVLQSTSEPSLGELSDSWVFNRNFCTHKILWKKEDYTPAVQHQRRVNPKIHDVIKKEVEKLLDAGLIYPISDSPWVSPVHCVPKKGGFTVVENEQNELISQTDLLRMAGSKWRGEKPISWLRKTSLSWDIKSPRSGIEKESKARLLRWEFCFLFKSSNLDVVDMKGAEHLEVGSSIRLEKSQEIELDPKEINEKVSSWNLLVRFAILVWEVPMVAGDIANYHAGNFRDHQGCQTKQKRKFFKDVKIISGMILSV
ncbi:hypothetical protein Tco_0551014 [Tanacetum coccineum]